MIAEVNTLATLTFEIIASFYRSYDVNSSSVGLSSLCEELRTVGGVLMTLEGSLKSNDKPHAGYSNHITPLKSLMSQLEERTKPNMDGADLEWPLTKKETDLFIFRIERIKTTLLLALDQKQRSHAS